MLANNPLRRSCNAKELNFNNLLFIFNNCFFSSSKKDRIELNNYKTTVAADNFNSFKQAMLLIMLLRVHSKT